MKYINGDFGFGKIEDFKGKTVTCNSDWNDDTSFKLDIGDGELTDKDGNPIFYHIEYNLDDGEWNYIFEIWWEEDNAPVTDELSKDEMQEIKDIIQKIIG